ncbi:MAG: chromate resistance protein ChrB domain-containing protein, partial [Pseudomonadota bacterium]
ALGFDFDGATFTHVGARVTFETLLASFGLESDAALTRVGNLVHCLDVGGVPQAEAQGLAAILAGARKRLKKDDVLLAESMKIFDHLYVAYSEKPGTIP